MRTLLPLVVAILMAGCTQTVMTNSVPEEPALAEVVVEAATFDLSGALMPFIVDLRDAVHVDVTLEPSMLAGVEIRPGLVIMTPEQWNLRGPCVPVNPPISVIGATEWSGNLAGGRYVVVFIGTPAGGSLSFEGGPEIPVPVTEGGSSMSMQSQSSLLGSQGEPVLVAPAGPSLVGAYLEAQPRPSEVIATHRVSVTGSELCGDQTDDAVGVPRSAAVWAWIDEEVQIRAMADALPVPPETQAGYVLASFETKS